jgi:hypothetical protein
MFEQLETCYGLVCLYLLIVESSTQSFNYQNKTEIIGCGSIHYYNTNHLRLYYRMPYLSNIELPSCEAGQHNLTLFWFAYEDICKRNRTQNSFFASVSPSGSHRCWSELNNNISNASCHNHYQFTRRSMTIINMTTHLMMNYTCLYGVAWSNMVNSSAVSYSLMIDGELIELYSSRNHFDLDKNQWQRQNDQSWELLYSLSWQIDFVKSLLISNELYYIWLLHQISSRVYSLVVLLEIRFVLIEKYNIYFIRFLNCNIWWSVSSQSIEMMLHFSSLSKSWQTNGNELDSTSQTCVAQSF